MGHIIKFFRSYISCGIYLLFIKGKVNRMIKHPNNYSIETKYKFAQNVIRKLLKKLKVTIEVSGLEYIETSNKLLLVPNHRSLLDCVLLVAVSDKPLSFIAKEEVEDLFVIGKLTRLLDTMYMQRNNLRQSMEIIKEATARLNDDRCVVVFPEGTRNRTTQPLLEFKAGSLKPALESKANISPVIIRNSEFILSSKVKKTYRVSIEVLPPITCNDYEDMSSIELSTQIKLLMEEQYKNPIKL